MARKQVVADDPLANLTPEQLATLKLYASKPGAGLPAFLRNSTPTPVSPSRGLRLSASAASPPPLRTRSPLVADAERRARRLVRDAEQQARELVSDAENRAMIATSRGVRTESNKLARDRSVTANRLARRLWPDRPHLALAAGRAQLDRSAKRSQRAIREWVEFVLDARRRAKRNRNPHDSVDAAEWKERRRQAVKAGVPAALVERFEPDEPRNLLAIDAERRVVDEVLGHGAYQRLSA